MLYFQKHILIDCFLTELGIETRTCAYNGKQSAIELHSQPSKSISDRNVFEI